LENSLRLSKLRGGNVLSHLTRRDFVGGLISAAAAARWSSIGAQDQERPNFIFILSDDQGWNGTSVSMDDRRRDARSDYYQTPNLQRLAEQGVRFTNGYCPAGLCCPTRRSLQFGQTPIRQGGDKRFAENYPPGNTKPTIPRVLKSIDARYTGAHFGKWDFRTDLLPEHVGYDESDGNTGNGDGNQGSSFSIGREDSWKRWVEYLITEDPKRIFSITTRACDFMRRQVRDKRPFYLQLSHYAVHLNVQAREESVRKAVFRKQGVLHRNIPFAAMTEDLDSGVGEILKCVEELGIQGRTYIFYLSDNGAVPWIPPSGGNVLSHPNELTLPSLNHPLRGGKTTVFEGGIRVPFIVKGPGIKPGSFSNVPVVGWDVLPTLADLAGREEIALKDLDGGSLRHVLEQGGEAQVKRPLDGLVFHSFDPNYPHTAIRVGDLKLIKFWKSKKVQLFNLGNDIGEIHDLADSMPAKTQELHAKLMGYLQQVDAEILKES
jgi:arylsulfatase A